MKLFLCPPEFLLDCGELFAAEEVSPSSSFLPWSGEVLDLSESGEAVLDKIEMEDPRLYCGVLDSSTAVNWVRYLPHNPLSNDTNILVHCLHLYQDHLPGGQVGGHLQGAEGGAEDPSSGAAKSDLVPQVCGESHRELSL